MQRTFTGLILLSILMMLSAQDPLKQDSLMTAYNFAASDTGKVHTLLELSDLFYNVDLSKSLEHANNALELAEETGNDLLVARSHLQIGKILILSGIYDEALKNCLASLKIYESGGTETDLFSNYLIIGSLYDRIFNYDEALSYYFKALNIVNELKKKTGTDDKSLNAHTLYNNIGNIYETRNENEKAIEYYNRALELGLTKKDHQQLGVVYNNLGKIHDKLGKYEEGYGYLLKSVEEREKIGDKAGLAKSYYFLSAHFFDLKDYNQSIKYAMMSNELGKQVGSIQTQQTAIWFLFRSYRNLGDYENALAYHMEFKTLSDSLLNNKTINDMTMLKMEYEFAAKETQKQLEIQQTRLRYIVTISILFLSLAILSFFFLIARNRAARMRFQRDNLEQDVEHKNKVLTTNVLYLIRKNEMISDISSRLLKLKSEMNKEQQESIQKIIVELGSVTNESIWQEFEYRFQQVHTQFYKNLQEKYPDLTPAEIKLAAFLRLNMSSKEISSITGQSIRSLEVARYRLRKKLNITNQEVNLITFLSEL